MVRILSSWRLLCRFLVVGVQRGTWCSRTLPILPSHIVDSCVKWADLAVSNTAYLLDYALLDKSYMLQREYGANVQWDLLLAKMHEGVCGCESDDQAIDAEHAGIWHQVKRRDSPCSLWRRGRVHWQARSVVSTRHYHHLRPTSVGTKTVELTTKY